MIAEYPNFLSKEECQMMIGIGECNYELFRGKTKSTDIKYRKAKVTWVESNDLVDKIKSEVSKITKTPIDNQEKLHFVKYEVGGEYKVHFDSLSRQKTAMIYLNNGFTGGETEFPNINRIIKPEIGKLVVWDNLLENDEDDPESFHAGLPVLTGTKYIVVIWIKK